MNSLLPYINSFGIGEKSDMDFPGESAGLVPRPSQWSGTTIATVPIGQGLAVTAVQMLAAYNTIAEGGTYIPPKLVDGYIDAEGNEHLFPSAPTHRVVSSLVAREMTSMLEGVVRVGTGTAARLEPYTVAGKTGTALVPSPQGGYIANDFVSSFAGFVPAEDPAITAMVVVEGTHQYGAEASAPVFAMIARDALQELGVPPQDGAAHPGVPQASVYGGEGEAAGPALPGLSGAPNVLVSSGPGSPRTTSTTTVPVTSTTVAAATTTAPVGGTSTAPATATTTGTVTTTAPAAATTTTTSSETITTAPSATTSASAATTTVAAATTSATTTAPPASTGEPDITLAGSPHSDISGSKPLSGSRAYRS